MVSFLAEVVAHKTSEIEAKKNQLSISALKGSLQVGEESFAKVLEGNGLKLIAELKPRSPALGDLDRSNDFDSRLLCYEKHAQAISVLCDEKYFGGSIDLLKDVSRKTKAPTLLKDFVIDEYQIFEGRAAGAQAALLIAKILDEQKLKRLYSTCQELRMTPVVEVQTKEEIEFVQSAVSPKVILINNRNLDDLKIDLNTVSQLVKYINSDAIVIAASGVENASDFLHLRPYASRFLIGSALMKTKNPETKFEEFMEAERRFLSSKKESKCLS